MTFVSITQSFNTTTSMGRLTLNILLSFAQFEREVTGERIRDKIAASKRRGMWMGGNVPVGYLVSDRKLIVNEPQAQIVRAIFERYLEVGSVVELVDVLEREGYRTEVKISAAGQMRGGVRYSRGMLYRLLTSPVYRGMIAHKRELFAGEHDAIVAQELWDRVQAQMLGRTQGHARRLKAKNPSLLVGLLFDAVGRAMTPNHSLKGKVRYRYYITRPELIDGAEAWRVSAHDLEALVCERLAALLEDQTSLANTLEPAQLHAQQTLAMIDAGTRTAGLLRSGHSAVRLQLINSLVERVELATDSIAIRTDSSLLLTALGVVNEPQREAEPVELTCAATRVWHGRQLRLVIPGPNDESGFRHRDPELVRLMHEVHQARELVLLHADKTVSAIARLEGRCRVRLDRLLNLACLAPDIVIAILEGRQPIGLSNTTLLSIRLPLDWAEQRTVLGFT